MFHSITTITITVVFLSIIIPSLVLWKKPSTVVGVAVSKLINDKKMLLHFGALFIILYFNKLELKLEDKLLYEDYTHLIHNWEGNLVYYIQQIFLNDQLTVLLTFFYIIVFPSLMVSSIIIYLNIEDYKSFYSFTYALMLNYAIAIPFFLFFPVYEVWYYDPNVQFLIPDVYTSFESEYRNLSGINNNFPSLHTAISMTIAIIAYKSESIKFSRVAIFSAGLIVFSTIYLGIHWLSDLAAGTLLAVIVTQTGFRLSEAVTSDYELTVRNR